VVARLLFLRLTSSTSKVGWQDGDRSKPRQYIHMTHKYSENQGGCQSMISDHDNAKWGIDWDDCQGTMKYILDNCESPSWASRILLTTTGDTDTVTSKYSGAVR